MDYLLWFLIMIMVLVAIALVLRSKNIEMWFIERCKKSISAKIFLTNVIPSVILVGLSLFTPFFNLKDPKWTFIPFFVLLLGVLLLFIFNRINYTSEEEEKKLAKDAIEVQKKYRQVFIVESYIRTIIEKKSDRFLEFFNKIKKKNTQSKKKEFIFNSITKPDEQIKLIVDALRSFFSIHYGENETIETNITLMKPKGNKLEFKQWIEKPKSINTPIFELGKSAAGIAWAKKSLVIVEDKQEELNKLEQDRIYEQGARNTTEDVGSLIAYPIIDEEGNAEEINGLLYIVNITVKKANAFKREDSEYYGGILESFAKRIILESRLRKIKKVI